MATSTTPFFGRAYSLTVIPSTGPGAGTAIVVSSDSFTPNALRVTFEIEQYAFSAFWKAEIVVYNANGPISTGPSKGINLYQAVIQEGDIVTVCAGYQYDYPYPQTPPVIFTGQIFYTIQDRLDVVDQRLIIHCLVNRALTTQNFLNSTVPALSTQFTQAREIASKSLNPIPYDESRFQAAVASADVQRAAANLPRGKSYLGNPHLYLQSLASQNNLVDWFDSKGWNADNPQIPIGELAATYAPVSPRGGPPAIVDGVKLSLIGQPQQTQFGVNFRVLLDPTIQVTSPFKQVSIQSQFIRQAPIAYPLPQGQGPPRPLSTQYTIIGVRFIGDTRGNPWYSEMTGVTPINNAIDLTGN